MLQRVGSMKNPLDYQISKYDCGSTAMLNDASFRFQGKDIPL
ncbi:hypothetical protein HMPREF0372_00291 [Flavonifractor plautii ATCC 29863]|nr:hypothetical protein HMPREF0372_00291 [Flavonifractor plautii ATCC 29863]